MSLLKNLFEQFRKTPQRPEAQHDLSHAADNSEQRIGENKISESAKLAWEEGKRQEAQGNLEGALASFHQALQLAPRHVGIRVDLAYALQNTGYADEAHKHLLEAHRLDKKNPAILSQMGYLSLSMGNLDAAIRRCREAIEIDPSYAPGWNNLGIAARRIGNVPYALDCFKKATEVNPDYGLAWSNLGLAYRDADDLENSVSSLRRALTLRQKRAPAYLNLATVLIDSDELEEAAQLLQQAQKLDPNLIDIDLALGAIELKRGLSTAAEKRFVCALEKAPNNSEARLCLAETQLLNRNFSAGWENYEARMDSIESPRKIFSYPLWNGESLTGKTLFIYAEQGIGDMILFSSCMPDILIRAGRVIIESGPKLHILFKNSFPSALIIESLPNSTEANLIELLGPVDYYIAAGSLFRLLRRDTCKFPMHSGYLKPSGPSLDVWQQKLSKLGAGLKVGIAWRGGLLKTGRQQRSIRLTDLHPILLVPGIHFINLQHQTYESDIDQLMHESGTTLTTFTEAFGDFNELGALVSSLDLVVTVCSSLAHLTGALGKAGFVLVPVGTNWRYLSTGETLPWYPSLRLLRQETTGNWAPVITRLEHLVRESALSAAR